MSARGVEERNPCPFEKLRQGEHHPKTTTIYILVIYFLALYMQSVLIIYMLVIYLLVLHMQSVLLIYILVSYLLFI